MKHLVKVLKLFDQEKKLTFLIIYEAIDRVKMGISFLGLIVFFLMFDGRIFV